MIYLIGYGIRDKSPWKSAFGGPWGPPGPPAPRGPKMGKIPGLPLGGGLFSTILQQFGLRRGGRLGKFATTSFVFSTEFSGRPVEIPPELAYY